MQPGGHRFDPGQLHQEKWRWAGGRVNRFMDSVFGLGPFLIPISAIVIGGVIVVVKMILSHQERIAKIERGIDPDVPRR